MEPIGHLHSQIIARPLPRVERLGDDDAACGLLNVKVHVFVPTWSASGWEAHNLSDLGSRSTTWDLAGRFRGAGSRCQPWLEGL